VDDGSTDSTAKVARSYPQAAYVYQHNQGVSSARNAGLRASVGDYVEFLDADDRLLPNAVEAGLDCFRKHSGSGFVFGRYRNIDANGMVVSAPNDHPNERDFYLALLQRNVIGMQSTVMYSRYVLQCVGGFEERLRLCEDYDVYLRIARDFPVQKHDEVVAEYRRHHGNTSRNFRAMLETTHRILLAQAPFVEHYPRYQAAAQAGIANWRHYYGSLMLQDFRHNIRTRGLDRGSIQCLGNLASSYLEGIGSMARTAWYSMIHRSLGMRP
jgi:glycosyltransferase involved in cell wall biosynthesis